MAPKNDIRYVQVAPCVPLGARGHEAYTYYVSHEADVRSGQVVRIPFGKRTITGVVVKTGIAKPLYPTKEILKVLPLVLSSLQLQFGAWLADSAHGGVGFTLRLFLPPSLTNLVSSHHLTPACLAGRPSLSLPRRGERKPVVIIEYDTKKRTKMLLKIVQDSSSQALILVPELAMLEAYEGTGAVIYHAGLLQSEKKAIWHGVQQGEIKTIVGTQKALFLPYQHLQTVLIDEEQYESHKLWEQYPRLHAVRGGLQLSRLAGADIILGSSYPSIALRYGMANGTYNIIKNNPIAITANVVLFSFEDRKWKRPVPDEVGRTIRAWARAGKTVLVLFNKKDAAKVRETLFWKLSVSAKQHIHLGTSALLSHAHTLHIDHVVWLFPELTMRAIDYRSGERTRILAARLQAITMRKSVTVATRYADFVRDVLGVSDDAWYAKILKERSYLLLPPITDMVRLTIRDAHAKKAYACAIKIREILQEKIAEKKHLNIFGPYQERDAKKKSVTEYFILLTGALEELVRLYKDVSIDSADVDPHRVI